MDGWMMQRLCRSTISDITRKFIGESIEWNRCELVVYRNSKVVEKLRDLYVFNLILFDAMDGEGKGFSIYEPNLINKSEVVGCFLRDDDIFLGHFDGFVSRWNLALGGVFVEQHVTK